MVGDVLLLHYRSLLRACARRPTTLSYSAPNPHASLIKTGILHSTPSISNALFHMYASCGQPSSALQAFDDIPFDHRTTVDWTALLSCHTRANLPSHALRLFYTMESDPVGPRGDEVTMVCVFGAAARLRDLNSGVLAHLLVGKRGLPFIPCARNAAMDMYVKCGRMGDARRLFDEMPEPTVVSWTVILSGALRWEGLDSGREVFDRMVERNEVAWTVMAAAYIEAGLPREALSVLAQMMLFERDGSSGLVNLNYASICSILSACSQAGDLAVALWVHTYITKTRAIISIHEDEEDTNHHYQLMVGSSLIDAYAKCGRIDTARLLFGTMHHRNVVTWNAMLNGLAMHGLSNEAKHMFSEMVAEGVQPDDISFVGLLSACSRSGLVEEGQKYFHELMPAYGVAPKLEHYACMVDVLGRTGRLEEAEGIIRQMPLRPNEVVLGSLLASCALHGKLGMGKRLMEELVEMDPLNTEYHVLLSNIYASSGKQPEAENVREDLRKRSIQKVPGVSFISINGSIHRFSAGDKSHPRTQGVYGMLDEMVHRLRVAGYIPDASASQVSRVMDGYLDNADEQEEREQALFSHSERLAIAFGLISTRPGAPLRIFKNLRICRDCHSAIKLISDIYKREIVVRDRNRFHCFKQGSCSCSDYW